MYFKYGDLGIKEIETIITVAKNKSFSEAALLLNYSPSVISKTIINVEKKLGMTMFIRGNRANTASLSKDGEAIMPSIIRLYDNIVQLENDLDALKKGKTDFLKIATSAQVSNYYREQIMSDFLVYYPEIHVEQSRQDFATMVHMLYSGSANGIFAKAQDDSKNMEMLRNMMNDPQIETYVLDKNNDMYLEISADSELAALSEAPFSAFKDYSIMFPSNKDILKDAGIVEPFISMCRKSGIAFSPMYVDPLDPSAHCIVLKMKVAIPTSRAAFTYPGIKHVKVTDWENYSLSCFLCKKSDNGRALAKLKKCVIDNINRNGKDHESGSALK